MRYKLTIEYDGGPYSGWQRQENAPSVQAAIEAAVRGFCGECVTLHGAGRTDSGVHALGQVAHLDLERPVPADRVRDALNAHLRPAPIAIVSSEAVSAEFHARFDAVKRAYLYRITDRRAPLALDRGRAWHATHRLDAERMHAAAQSLVGKHDFTTFRAAACQAKTALKTLDWIEVRRDGDAVEIRAEARSFLHHQVRSITGSLKYVGEGKWQPDDIARVLAACDRAACGPVAPAHGLYLTRVDY